MLSTGVKMDTSKWKSVAIRKEIVETAAIIGESNVFAYAVRRLKDDLDSGKLNDVPKA